VLGRATAQPVVGPIAGHRRQPAARPPRHAVDRPARQRLGEGVLGALLGQIPVAGQPDQSRDDPAPFLLEGAGDGGLRVVVQGFQNGLTSRVPCSAIGCLAATSMASSRSAHSRMSKPAMCSLVSANGPSAISTSPSRRRTVVASLTDCSWLPSNRTPRESISSVQLSVSFSRAANCSDVSLVAGSAQTNSMYFIVSPLYVRVCTVRELTPARGRSGPPLVSTTNGAADDGHCHLAPAGVGPVRAARQ